jgi:hypothetical protein
MERDTETALKWILWILEEPKVDFLISGGFAVRAYGSQRELADIDIEVPDKDIPAIAEKTKEYIIFGPQRYKDNFWILNLMTLKYSGQNIDIVGRDEAHIFNMHKGEWQVLNPKPKKKVIMEAYGMKLPIDTKEELIRYKSIIGRDVDMEDVKFLKQLNEK